MWIIFAVASMVLCALGEITSKKIIKDDLVTGPLMVYSAASFFTFLSSIAMWLLGLGESGETPIRILIQNPLIMLSTASTFLATFLMFIALKYIGVSVESTISGVSAAFLFLGLISISIFTGKLNSANELLAPGRLIPIIVIIVLIFLLSGTDKTVESTVLNQSTGKSKKHSAMLIGVFIMLASCIFDASDSLIVSYCIADNLVGDMDYYIATNFMDILFGLICFIITVIRLKKSKSSFKSQVKKIPFLIISGILGIGSMLTYFIGSGYDAVKLAMLYIIYPVVPLIGARLILKERYTVKQYFCIFGIVIASIVFGIMDYV